MTAICSYEQQNQSRFKRVASTAIVTGTMVQPALAGGGSHDEKSYYSPAISETDIKKVTILVY